MTQASYTVGQVVGILRTGSWNCISEGKYIVTKVNKVRVELARVGDGYARVFSVRTGNESSEFASKNTYIVSEERLDAHNAQKEAERVREQSIIDIKNAASKLGRYCVSKDEIAILRALLDEAEKFALIA